MSIIGANIKKIRGVKNLNQSDFAKLFKLKRASIGSYEEGRAEPKISTICDIANYFGISIDDLITKELSVNDLSRFDVFRHDLAGDIAHNLTPSHAPVDILPVVFISMAQKATYINQTVKEGTLPALSLPLPKGKIYRAFELTDNAMTSGAVGAGTNDIAVGARTEKFGINDLEVGKTYIFETETDILFRVLGAKNLSNLTLQPLNPNHYQQTINNKDLKKVWQVVQIITKNIGNQNIWQKQILDLENEVKLLKSRIA